MAPGYSGNFFIVNFTAKHLFKCIKNGKKPLIRAIIIQKWPFVTFAILTDDVSN